MSTFAERFKQLRLEKELTQKELANKFFCSKSNISKYENGVQLPEVDTLKQYAEFFNVSIDYMLGKSENKNPIPKEELYVKVTPETKELLEVFDKLTPKEKEYVIEDSRTLLSNKPPYYYFYLEKDEYIDISDPKLSIEEKLQFLFDNKYLDNLKAKESTKSSGNLIPYHLNQELVNNFLAKKQKPNK